MDLFLLRHGEAGPYIPDDASRQLTPRGRQQLKAICGANAHALSAVQQVWVSPYVRAQQTLDEAKPFLPASVLIHTVDWLTPDTPLNTTLSALGPALATQKVCLLVTHQPLIGLLLNQLCDFPAGRYTLGTSALAALSLNESYPGAAHLRWLNQP